MSKIENLREKLHLVIEQGDVNIILEISQELDELICDYLKKHRYF